jgi:hypothetical protein
MQLNQSEIEKLRSEQKLCQQGEQFINQKILYSLILWKFSLCGRKVFCCAVFAQSTWNKHSGKVSFVCVLYMYVTICTLAHFLTGSAPFGPKFSH